MRNLRRLSGRPGIAVGLILLLGAGLLAVAAWRPPREYASEQFLMDTLVRIEAYGRDEAQLRAAVTAAFAEMRRVADLADNFAAPGSPACAASDVCRINQAAGREPVRVQPETLEMLALARRYGELSGGAFDVTVGPLVELWGFGRRESRSAPPAPAELAAALALVDYRELLVDATAGTVLLRRPGMRLDLGAVAKGYAAERAQRVLQQHGIAQALIDAGGNIRVLGENRRGRPWQIGVKDPRGEGRVIAVLPLVDAAAVTSGDYYRYVEIGGRRYHHLLDPKTGYPAAANLSLTVVAADAGLADVLSTTLFVLPPEQALALAARAGVEALLVSADRRILHTPGLDGQIEVRAGTEYRHDPRR